MYPTQNLGTSHADDLMYLYQMTPIIDLIPSDRDKQMSRDMVRMWTNFAKYGDPNDPGESLWKASRAIDTSDNLYLVIAEESRMERFVDLERFKFWRR